MQGEDFQEDTVSVSERVAAEALIVDVDGFEGPLDLLLTLSRTQKVDLRQISILALARTISRLYRTGQAAAVWNLLPIIW